jgi:hypothetical protein
LLKIETPGSEIAQQVVAQLAEEFFGSATSGKGVSEAAVFFVFQPYPYSIDE